MIWCVHFGSNPRADIIYYSDICALFTSQQNSPYHPTTMNVIDQDTAWSHLEQTEFFVNDILDEALLPLGVAPELLPSN